MWAEIFDVRVASDLTDSETRLSGVIGSNQKTIHDAGLKGDAP